MIKELTLTLLYSCKDCCCIRQYLHSNKHSIASFDVNPASSNLRYVKENIVIIQMSGVW